ncbi:MAG: TOPRIM nucleotidyl transferase/hydrolase domain-containing protein [Limosilactobacillus reuteri]|nr:TOPRIM nucleotidyl transferase/hydrolase domain-containing protein [Limosilactobacillus reuteri]
MKYSPDKKVLSVNGKRILKLIVSVDEPELHLHPNMQKKTIRDIKDIVEGNDNEFNKLVKLLFNIDALDGQLIIVTHSPNILSADYRYICRAYQAKNGGTDFACGNRISFDEKVAKELIAELAEVKEVLFADKVMLCEGQTEQTAIPVFAEKLNKDLLSENVNIMAVHGKDNLGKFITIFNELKVKNWAVIDKDDNNNNKQKYTKNKNLLFTNERDFEEECFKVMNLDNMIDFFIEFNQYKGTCNNRMNAFWIGFLSERGKNILTKTGDLKQLSNFMDADEKQNLRNEIKSRFMSKYMKAKSTITGKLIAKNVNEVPAVYQNLIEKVFSKDGE